MSKRVERILDDIRDLVGDNELLESDNKELAEAYTIKCDEVDKMNYEIKELKNKIDILNRSYINMVEECDRQSKKNENLTNVIRELQNNIFDLNKKNIKLNEENIELKDESKKDKILIRSLEADKEKLQKEISDLKKELDMYKQLENFGSHYKIKTGSMNPGEINMTLELNDQFSVTVTERWNTHE